MTKWMNESQSDTYLLRYSYVGIIKELWKDIYSVESVEIITCTKTTSK